MQLFTQKKELTDYLAAARGRVVGFVPTMGALHAGHLSLVDRAREECDVVVVSLFVNPTQFNDPNDLRNYPRTLEADLELLRGRNVDAVFAPPVEEIYPEPDTRRFDFGLLDKVMEGATRPGHFNGVAQVVSRLFEIVNPDRAYFGQKDFQQVAVIRALVGQEGRAVEIVECPIVRDADGLALSSRNTLLDPTTRAAAPHIHATLRRAAGRRDLPPAELEAWVAGQIDSDPHLKTIYFQIVDPHTLQPIASWDETQNPRGCIAVQAGNVRLIDNIEM